MSDMHMHGNRKLLVYLQLIANENNFVKRALENNQLYTVLTMDRPASQSNSIYLPHRAKH